MKKVKLRLKMPGFVTTNMAGKFFLMSFKKHPVLSVETGSGCQSCACLAAASASPPK